MDFLTREFENIPPGIKRTLFRLLEKELRAIQFAENSLTDNTSLIFCANIRAVLNTAREIRKDLEQINQAEKASAIKQ